MLYSPKNRDREGLILRKKIRENTVLSVLDRLSVAGVSFVPPETRLATRLARQLNIKAESVETMCQNLSGGNRQKVVLAKLLATEGDIFLLDNPTRGIDIGARAEIYQLMNQLTAAGAGIVMVSDELQELLQMSDIIHVVRDGRVSKTFARSDNPQEGDLIRHMI
jgi:ABC-type sugar transport system ATPase subunit